MGGIHAKLSTGELATKYFNNTEQDRKVFTSQLILQKTVYFSAKKSQETDHFKPI